jgi:hypothetical protein
MNLQSMNLVMIPESELVSLKASQAEILNELKNIQAAGRLKTLNPTYVTAKEYMAAVKICRSKFDQLIAGSKIKTIKKRRKIYVPSSEIERYFIDPSIQ